MTETERKPFKDYFDASAASELAKLYAPHVSRFQRDRFLAVATEGLEALEMTDRVALFGRAIQGELPQGRKKRTARLRILRKALPSKLEGTEDVTSGFLLWPVGHAIAEEGEDCTPEEVEEAMETMEALTQCFTSEFAVRPYVEADPEGMAARLLALTTHPSEHVRRWCSEGLRPRLPWGRVLRSYVEDPAPVLPVLEALKDDPSLYVRRSVANTLNDIAKDHPKLVISLCGRWAKGASKERQWVVGHALRVLVKKGDAGALAVLGFRDRPDVAAGFSLRAIRGEEAANKNGKKRAKEPVALEIGERLQVDFEVTNEGEEPAKVLVDYIVHYVKARGGTSPKTFKGKTLSLAPGQTERFRKTLHLAHRSIRKLYPGEHRVEVQLNGHRRGSLPFVLHP